jgi:hypothetical protein
MNFTNFVILLGVWTVVVLFIYITQLEVFRTAKHSNKDTYVILHTMWMVIVTGVTYHISTYAVVIPILMISWNIRFYEIDPSKGMAETLRVQGHLITCTIKVFFNCEGGDVPRPAVSKIATLLKKSNALWANVVAKCTDRNMPLDYSSNVTALIQYELNNFYSGVVWTTIFIAIGYAIFFDWLWTALSDSDSSAIVIVFCSFCVVWLLRLYYNNLKHNMARRGISNSDIVALRGEIPGLDIISECVIDLSNIKLIQLLKNLNYLIRYFRCKKLDFDDGIMTVTMKCNGMKVSVGPDQMVETSCKGPYGDPSSTNRFRCSYKPVEDPLMPVFQFSQFVGETDYINNQFYKMLLEALATFPNELVRIVRGYIANNVLLEELFAK